MKRALILSFLVLTISAHAQSLSASLVSSIGASLALGDISLAIAVGQPIVGDVATANVFVSQGFLMPSTATVITGVLEHEATVGVYPNPTTGQLFVGSEQNLQNLHVDLIDITGKLIPVAQTRSDNLIELGLHDIAPAFYLLRMQQPSGQVKIVSIIKLNR